MHSFLALFSIHNSKQAKFQDCVTLQDTRCVWHALSCALRSLRVFFFFFLLHAADDSRHSSISDPNWLRDTISLAGFAVLTSKLNHIDSTESERGREGERQIYPQSHCPHRGTNRPVRCLSRGAVKCLRRVASATPATKMTNPTSFFALPLSLSVSVSLCRGC